MSSGTHEGYRRHGTARDLEHAIDALEEALAAVEGRANALRSALLVAHRDGILDESDTKCAIFNTDPREGEYLKDARWAVAVIVRPALARGVA